MNYFRKIIYLSEYDGGECLGNIGFVKLSKKQTRLKLEIVLSEDRTLRGEKVYLLDKDEYAVNRVFFGTIMEDGKEITLEKVTAEKGMIKGKLAGVLIGGEGYVLCAGMEDESVRVTDYVKAERETERAETAEKPEPPASKISVKGVEMQEECETAAEVREEPERKEVEEKKEEETKEEEPPEEEPAEKEPVEEKPPEKPPEEEPAEEEPPEKPPEEEPAEEEPVEEKPPEKPPEEEPAEEGEMIEVELEEEHDPAHMYRKLFQSCPNMYPFEDDEMEECVQICPADFSSFPNEYWHMASNTFLLQGYYNYRHLILARKGDKIYVGVPGQYHRRDKYMADMFGFGRFKSILRKKERLGDFGYWMMEIEVPPSSEDAVCVAP